MSVRHWTFGVICAATLMTVIGCYSYYPSSGYGPGMYSPQPGTVAPGTLPPGSGSTFAPGTGTQNVPTPSNGSGWQPGGTSNYGGDAPAFDSETDGVPGGVPNYEDPNGPDDGSTSGQFDGTRDFNDTESFGQESSYNERNGTTPFSAEGASGESSFEGAAADEAAADAFLAPAVPVQPASNAETVVQSTAKTQIAPDPYKYDRDSYSWLRGVVDYDDRLKSWNIIYSLEPEQQDGFGGSITLLGADAYPSLKAGDVVLVEGRIDDDHPDAFGKPQYRVDNLQRLEPSY